MCYRGQTTSFQVRLEMMEQASAGLNDRQIATALGCSVWTVRKWRRRSHSLGRVGLASHMGRPATGPLSTFPEELKEAILHLRTLQSWLGTQHPSSYTQNGCLLVRPAAAQSSTHRQAAQTSRFDAPLSTPSRSSPTTTYRVSYSASRMADGCTRDYASERGGHSQSD